MTNRILFSGLGAASRQRTKAYDTLTKWIVLKYKGYIRWYSNGVVRRELEGRNFTH